MSVWHQLSPEVQQQAASLLLDLSCSCWHCLIPAGSPSGGACPAPEAVRPRVSGSPIAVGHDLTDCLLHLFPLKC